MAFNTTLCNNSAISHVPQSFQCLDGQFGTLRNTNKNYICSYSIIGLPYESKWKMSANCTSSFLIYHNPFSNLLQHKISASLHIELLIDHMLVCLQEICPIPTLIDATMVFLWPTCFHKESNLATKSLSHQRKSCPFRPSFCNYNAIVVQTYYICDYDLCNPMCPCSCMIQLQKNQVKM